MKASDFCLAALPLRHGLLKITKAVPLRSVVHPALSSAVQAKAQLCTGSTKIVRSEVDQSDYTVIPPEGGIVPNSRYP